MLVAIAPARADLHESIDEVVARPEFASALVGVAVCDPATSEMLYEHNAGKSMLPASTMKTVSCAFALEMLGPKHTFRTEAKAAGVTGGVVDGPLYLVGSGYPYTYASTFADLAEAIAEAGVERVAGGIVADVSRFEGRRWRSGWTADDFLYYYGAWPDAINLNRQRVYFTVSPTQAGQPAEVTWDIPEADISVTNEAVTVAADDETSLWIDRALESNEYTVTGTIAEGSEPQEIRRALVDPGLAAAAVLAARLRDQGVEVRGDVRYGVAPGDTTEVAGVDSAPLADAIEVVLKYSDNLGAELMVWNTAVERGKGARFADAMAYLSEWLEDRGMPMGGLRLSDGSGLSRYNYLTPRFLALHLAEMTESLHFGVFKECLPVAGVDGTLGNRFQGGAVEGRVSAKTGSLSRVSCLTGYAPRPEGSLMTFAILVNGYECSISDVYRAQEGIMTAVMTEDLREPGS
jgi:D-alanyl-D-alanine carboxypeptidase/D-alanyl-D-alanine-endopeptidase (penicillin-binding protein 4)